MRILEKITLELDAAGEAKTTHSSSRVVRSIGMPKIGSRPFSSAHIGHASNPSRAIIPPSLVACCLSLVVVTDKDKKVDTTSSSLQQAHNSAHELEHNIEGLRTRPKAVMTAVAVVVMVVKHNDSRQCCAVRPHAAVAFQRYVQEH